MEAFQETRLRSATKAFSWRIVGSVVTTGVAWVATRRVSVSLAVGAADFALKIGLFWVHERAWNRIAFGKHAPQPHSPCLEDGATIPEKVAAERPLSDVNIRERARS